MNATPPVSTKRLAQLSAGDLYMLPSQVGGHVGLVVHDRTADETLSLPIGPTLPASLSYPTLMSGVLATVISFGHEFTVQLPTDVAAWQVEEPSPDVIALAITESGTFLRCNFSPREGQFQACYVDLADGEICTNGTGAGAVFTRPQGISAFASRWALLTTEARPRPILTYPFTTGL